MVCNYFYKSIPRSETNFVLRETQHNTRQPPNQVLHAHYIYLIQTTQSITLSRPRISSSVPVNTRGCGSFYTCKCRLKAHISSNNGS